MEINFAQTGVVRVKERAAMVEERNVVATLRVIFPESYDGIAYARRPCANYTAVRPGKLRAPLIAPYIRKVA